MFCADLPEVRARDVTLSIRSLCPRVMSPLKNWGPRLAAFLGFYHWSLRQFYVLPHSEQEAASPHFHTQSVILTPGRSVESDDEKSRFFHAARPGFEPRTFRMRGRHATSEPHTPLHQIHHHIHHQIHHHIHHHVHQIHHHRIPGE